MLFLDGMHHTLNNAKIEFFKDMDTIDEKRFQAFKLTCETELKLPEKTFQHNPGIWNDYVMPVLKDILGVLVLIMATLLTAGILPIVAARHESVRQIYVETFFKSPSMELPSAAWKKQQLRSTLFGDTDSKEKGLIPEIEESLEKNKPTK